MSDRQMKKSYRDWVMEMYLYRRRHKNLDHSDGSVEREKKGMRQQLMTMKPSTVHSSIFFVLSFIQFFVALILGVLCNVGFVYGVIDIYGDADEDNSFYWFWVAPLGVVMASSYFIVVASCTGMGIGLYGCVCFVTSIRGNYIILCILSAMYFIFVVIGTIGLHLVGMFSFLIGVLLVITIIYAICSVPFFLFCIVEFFFTASGTGPCAVVGVTNCFAPLFEAYLFRKYGPPSKKARVYRNWGEENVSFAADPNTSISNNLPSNQNEWMQQTMYNYQGNPPENVEINPTVPPLQLPLGHQQQNQIMQPIGMMDEQIIGEFKDEESGDKGVSNEPSAPIPLYNDNIPPEY